jgi:hypothetical protein
MSLFLEADTHAGRAVTISLSVPFRLSGLRR